MNCSWRQSTLTTYYPAINRWLTWSELHGVNPRVPPVHQIARFLAHLHLEKKLAYSTILVHKSAISTFCGFPSEDMSNQLLIRQVLKAISTSQPKRMQVPIWDAQVIFDWLMTSEFKNTFFEASRRTATILLLASGRRVHDLTLLKVSEANMESSEQEILLWPAFGSKTDSAAHRQSGWLLSKHPNEKVCPVTWVRRLLLFSQARRDQVNGLDHLFISLTGEPRPASRTVIGGWIRSVLKSAGIEASPGSFRSAVASASWIENHPIQEILARGNWKSENTFKKFYCKEVYRSRNIKTDLLFSNFQPK